MLSLRTSEVSMAIHANLSLRDFAKQNRGNPSFCYTEGAQATEVSKK